jgi:hypothetical protein
MKSSEQINELATALSKAQGAWGALKKDSRNPHFGNKYASLSAIFDVVQAPLAENGLSLLQLPQPTGEQEVCVETVVLHTSGQWISCEVALPVSKADAQGFGSAVTYAKRYGAAAILRIAADEDDDAESARKAAPPNRVEIAGTAGFVVDKATGEVTPERVEDPVVMERSILLHKIQLASGKRKLSQATRADLWRRHCGEATVRNADPAALKDLLREIEDAPL